jgi:transcriptional regulator with XRE-family HTH domain
VSGKEVVLARWVARLITEERTQQGVSQEQLAERLGMATRNYQRIESGRQNLTLETIERIADALGVPSRSLLDGGSGVRLPAASSPLARLEAAGFRVVLPTTPGRKPRGAVQLTTLRAAAGRMGRAARASEILGWVDLGRPSSSPQGQFIAEIEGQSMAPRIPGGSLCLFGPTGPAPLGDRIFLVSVGARVDDDASASYFLKRIRSIHQLDDGRTRVTLESINPSVAPLSIETHADDDLRIVAELVRVLVPGS